jgi:hypothetical protein
VSNFIWLSLQDMDTITDTLLNRSLSLTEHTWCAPSC